MIIKTVGGSDGRDVRQRDVFLNDRQATNAGELDLANALREERKSAELQPLGNDFYHRVGLYLAELEMELSRVHDHYSVEAQIIEDELKSGRKTVTKLIDLRIKKVTRRALRRASSSSRSDVMEGMTDEEQEIYKQLLLSITKGRESIIAHLAHDTTERPLTGKKDIGQEYAAIRLLDSVPMFIGVDGRRYLLSKDDVVMLPIVHARNLCNKQLASEVRMR